jgi:dinuclear metal center YbgI/SA1388 family protein
MVEVKKITEYLNEELKIYDIEDSSSNGLQVETEVNVQKIGFAVDGCLENFQKAIHSGCQMLIVHHGIIWDGIKYIQGNTYQKIQLLIKNDLALYAAHLPLDRHPTLGNNAQLAQVLGLQNLKPFGYYNNKPIGWMGDKECTLEQIQEIMKNNGMKSTSLPFGNPQIKTIAIVSGGAGKETMQAIKAKVDLYITGEGMQYLHHLAKENRINVLFGGHYETETWGVKALMPVLQEKFKVEVEFIDTPTII